MKQKGFTLIELLVVIAIIGILTALITVNLTGLQQRGRDADRKGDLEKIRTALERYYGDLNEYPDSITFGSALSTGSPPSVVTYLDQVPTDPRNNTQFRYHYCTTSTTVGATSYNLRYRIYANLENDRDPARYCGSTSGWTSLCDKSASWSCTPDSGLNLSTVDYAVKEP